jgi:hypothetical protein
MQWVSNVRQTIDAMKVFVCTPQKIKNKNKNYKNKMLLYIIIIYNNNNNNNKYISYTTQPYTLGLAKGLSKDGRTKK